METAERVSYQALAGVFQGAAAPERKALTGTLAGSLYLRESAEPVGVLLAGEWSSDETFTLAQWPRGEARERLLPYHIIVRSDAIAFVDQGLHLCEVRRAGDRLIVKVMESAWPKVGEVVGYAVYLLANEKDILRR